MTDIQAQQPMTMRQALAVTGLYLPLLGIFFVPTVLIAVGISSRVLTPGFAAVGVPFEFIPAMVVAINPGLLAPLGRALLTLFTPLGRLYLRGVEGLLSLIID